ncbi:MAG: C1 family peptidase [Runella sp.]
MRKLLPTLYLYCILSNVGIHAQGLNFNDSLYVIAPRKQVNFMVQDSIPAKVDLSMYVPSVLNQGRLGTCVGVSTAYYMRTMLEAIRLGITDRSQIDDLRFSPSYLYNNIKQPQDSDCSQGSEINQALEYLKTQGVVRYVQQPYPHCEANKSIQPTPDSKLLDYVRLFGFLDESVNKVLATKKALAEMTPVVIGIQTTPSIDNLGFWGSLWRKFLRFLGVISEEEISLWKPETSKRLRGGHAVCVVGYDDTKFGGAFRAVNSRGAYWGDDGFFWIRYADYPQHTKYAYQAVVRPKDEADDIVLAADLTMEFNTFTTDSDVPFVRQNTRPDSLGMIAYSLLQPQLTGTTYRFSAYLSKMSYLYILNANAPQLYTQTIYPLTDSISTLIGANTKVMLPGEQSRLTYRLSEPTGTEYLLFLFSEIPLDIRYYVSLINQGQGGFVGRVQAAFGEELIPYQAVNYKEKKIGFELRGKHPGHIVPLLVSFQHLPRRRLF